MTIRIQKNIIFSETTVSLDYIKEICYSATKKEISSEEAEKALKSFSSNIINGIIQWGESDSVVRDNIYEWFEENNVKQVSLEEVRFIDVKWDNAHNSIPIRIISAIDSEGSEKRRIEYLKDGICRIVSEDLKHPEMNLSDAIVPSLEEINSNNEFEGKEITKDDFEKLWNKGLFFNS